MDVVDGPGLAAGLLDDRGRPGRAGREVGLAAPAGDLDGPVLALARDEEQAALGAGHGDAAVDEGREGRAERRQGRDRVDRLEQGLDVLQVALGAAGEDAAEAVPAGPRAEVGRPRHDPARAAVLGGGEGPVGAVEERRRVLRRRRRGRDAGAQGDRRLAAEVGDDVGQPPGGGLRRGRVRRQLEQELVGSVAVGPPAPVVDGAPGGRPEGRQELVAGRGPAARVQATEAVDVGAAEARLVRGQALLGLGRPEDAAAEAAGAMAQIADGQGPGRAQNVAKLAWRALRAGARRPAALETLEAAAARGDLGPEVLAWLAVARWLAGERGASRAALEAWVVAGGPPPDPELRADLEEERDGSGEALLRWVGEVTPG